jgi:hypothetical protein
MVELMKSMLMTIKLVLSGLLVNFELMTFEKCNYNIVIHTAIRSVLSDNDQLVHSAAKEAREQRRLARNTRRTKEKEEEDRKKSDQMSYEKTRLELEAEREVN